MSLEQFSGENIARYARFAETPEGKSILDEYMFRLLAQEVTPNQQLDDSTPGFRNYRVVRSAESASWTD
jgi:hypothetical protein